MKNAATHLRKLHALVKQLRGQIELPPAGPRDPVVQLVLAFLQWEAGSAQAQAAWDRLMAQLVDVNDLRVSHPHEVVRLLGERYPRVEERCARLHDSLQEIFKREHGMTLEPLGKRSKKDIRAYLDSLPGMPQYVAAQVALLCFGVHAMPVDQVLAQRLAAQGVAEADAAPEVVASFLEHHVKAEEALEVHRLLRAWVDAGPKAAGKPARRPARAKTGKARQ